MSEEEAFVFGLLTEDNNHKDKSKRDNTPRCPSCGELLRWSEKKEKYVCAKCKKSYDYWEVV